MNCICIFDDNTKAVIHILRVAYVENMVVNIIEYYTILKYALERVWIIFASFCNVLEVTNCILWTKNVSVGATVNREFTIIAYFHWITWHIVCIVFDGEIYLMLRIDLHYAMVIWLSRLILNLKEILLPMLSSWHNYLPTLGL